MRRFVNECNRCGATKETDFGYPTEWLRMVTSKEATNTDTNVLDLCWTCKFIFNSFMDEMKEKEEKCL